MEPRSALLPQADHCPRLGSRADFDFYLTVNCGDFDISSQYCQRIGNYHLYKDIVAVPFKYLVRLDVYREDKIPEINTHAFANAGRYLYLSFLAFDLDLFVDPTDSLHKVYFYRVAGNLSGLSERIPPAEKLLEDIKRVSEIKAGKRGAAVTASRCIGIGKRSISAGLLPKRSCPAKTSRHASRREGVVSKLVISGALLGIGKNLISLVYLFEAPFGRLLVVFVPIRMPL